MSCVLLGDLPDDTRRKLPRYPLVPVARIGRLAVDVHYQGRRLGGALLVDAIARTVAAEVAAYAIVVDAKDGQAADFYQHFGFLPLARNPRTLFLPVSEGLKKVVG